MTSPTVTASPSDDEKSLEAAINRQAPVDGSAVTDYDASEEKRLLRKVGLLADRARYRNVP